MDNSPAKRKTSENARQNPDGTEVLINSQEQTGLEEFSAKKTQKAKV